MIRFAHQSRVALSNRSFTYGSRPASDLRKPKSLTLPKSIAKVEDLKPMLLATSLAQIHPSITQQTLMRCGGESFELRRRALQEFKVSDSSHSLNIRLSLAQRLQSSEKAWKSRMLQILSQGQVAISYVWGVSYTVSPDLSPLLALFTINLSFKWFEYIMKLLHRKYHCLRNCPGVNRNDFQTLAVADMDAYSVISQHSTIVSLRRSVGCGGGVSEWWKCMSNT